jgi:hypothetical protein
MATKPDSEPTATLPDMSSNGSQAIAADAAPAQAIAADAAPAQAVVPDSSTEPTPAVPAVPPAQEPPPAPRGVVAASRSRWMIIHPHVSFFSWLADKQGPIDAPAEVRLGRYRRESPGLFKLCVILDLLVLFAVSVILVVALAAALYKVIWGVA